MRLEISAGRLYDLKFKDLYAVGLADGETEGQKKQKATGLIGKNYGSCKSF